MNRMPKRSHSMRFRTILTAALRTNSIPQSTTRTVLSYKHR